VEAGAPLAVVHANDERELAEVTAGLQRAIEISDQRKPAANLIEAVLE
jgi:thymidine phosphorylase